MIENSDFKDEKKYSEGTEVNEQNVKLILE